MTLYVGVYKLVVTGASGSTTQQVVTVTVMSEGGEASEGVEGVDYAPISVTEFGAYVADLHAGSNKKFKDLYKVKLVLSCVQSTIIIRVFNPRTHTHTHTLRIWTVGRGVIQ